MQTARNTALARELRRQTTWAERALWRKLKDRTVAGRKFRRQHNVGPYVLDFYCPELELAIELDGGQHDLPARRAHDERRTAFLAENGIRVLRFWHGRIRENVEGVLAAIRAECERAKLAPHPGPLPAGEREERGAGAPRSDEGVSDSPAG